LVEKAGAQSRTLRHLSDEEVKTIQATLAKRMKDQTPQPGSEAAVRTLWSGIRARHPDYDKLAPAFAETTRAQLPDLAETFDRLGDLQSVTFERVAPNGADLYQVKFANGMQEWQILMADDGRIDSVGLRAI
jgi:hypothetical protein